MTFWLKVKSLLNGKPHFDTESDHRIIPAFIHKGIQYYQFEDINNLMSGRAFAAIDYYNELQMRCTREFLQAHCTAMGNILSDRNQINIGKLALLNQQLKERLDMILDVDIIYKIASVVYFDDTEKPYNYDFRYGYKKIETWKKSQDINDFFLSRLIKTLIPALNLSDQDLKTYMKVGEKVNQEHLKNIFSLLSEKDMKQDFYKTLNLQTQAT